jgi:glycosyltransferase involved in cell wall biosynthesis
MTKQKASIIIPVKNRTELFEKALNSAINQTYRPLEIIVVDDGSGNEEFEIISGIVAEKAYQKDEHLSISIFKNSRKGAAGARNEGFLQSHGTLIQFLDSDDILLPTKIEEQAEVLASNDKLDLVYSIATFIDNDEKPLTNKWGQSLTNTSKDFFNFSYQTMCPLYKRSAIEKYGLWDERLKINQDWEFNVRYLILGANTYFLEKTLALYRMHNHGNIGKSDRVAKIIESKFLAHQKIFELLQEKNKLDALLTKLFLKRFFYIYLITSIASEKTYTEMQRTFIKKNFPVTKAIPLKIFEMTGVNKLVIFIYDLIRKLR